MKSGKFCGQMSDRLRTAIFIVLSGGFQDAYTYCCKGEVFANAQTGNIVFFGASLFRCEWQTALKYLIPVLSFAVGIAVAEWVQTKFKYAKKLHWRQMILICEILILFSVGFIPDGADRAANVLVSFVCAMQVQTFHTVRGHVYASTMCIGNMRSGTEALCAFFRTGEIRILKKAAVYFGIIGIFAIGAGIGSLVTFAVGSRAIWVCCLLLSVSFCMMFKKDTSGS